MRIAFLVSAAVLVGTLLVNCSESDEAEPIADDQAKPVTDDEIVEIISELESMDKHFSLPRIAGLFDDLKPASGGTVSWKQEADRAVVTFENVPQYGGSDTNSFQIEMFYSGVIRLTHLTISATDGLAGLSCGIGSTPAGFSESDLSSYPQCADEYDFGDAPDPAYPYLFPQHLCTRCHRNRD